MSDFERRFYGMDDAQRRLPSNLRVDRASIKNLNDRQHLAKLLKSKEYEYLQHADLKKQYDKLMKNIINQKKKKEARLKSGRVRSIAGGYQRERRGTLISRKGQHRYKPDEEVKVVGEDSRTEMKKLSDEIKNFRSLENRDIKDELRNLNQQSYYRDAMLLQAMGGFNVDQSRNRFNQGRDPVVEDLGNIQLSDVQRDRVREGVILAGDSPRPDASPPAPPEFNWLFTPQPEESGISTTERWDTSSDRDSTAEEGSTPAVSETPSESSDEPLLSKASPLMGGFTEPRFEEEDFPSSAGTTYPMEGRSQSLELDLEKQGAERLRKEADDLRKEETRLREQIGRERLEPTPLQQQPSKIDQALEEYKQSVIQDPSFTPDQQEAVLTELDVVSPSPREIKSVRTPTPRPVDSPVFLDQENRGGDGGFKTSLPTVVSAASSAASDISIASVSSGDADNAPAPPFTQRASVIPPPTPSPRPPPPPGKPTPPSTPKPPSLLKTTQKLFTAPVAEAVEDDPGAAADEPLPEVPEVSEGWGQIQKGDTESLIKKYPDIQQYLTQPYPHSPVRRLPVRKNKDIIKILEEQGTAEDLILYDKIRQEATEGRSQRQETREHDFTVPSVGDIAQYKDADGDIVRVEVLSIDKQKPPSITIKMQSGNTREVPLIKLGSLNPGGKPKKYISKKNNKYWEKKQEEIDEGLKKTGKLRV